MAQLNLHKYHGLRNDFLFHLNGTKREITTEMVKHMCDRVEGVGADGFISVEKTDNETIPFRMNLWNSDGSKAEMSGNGLRCLAHCLVDYEWAEVGDVNVMTDGGFRSVHILPETANGVRTSTANMGVVTLNPLTDEMKKIVGDSRAAYVITGNPHLVIHDDEQKFHVAVVGELAQSLLDGGINVEVIIQKDSDLLDMKVFERGVGITESCGTGATAVAAAFNDWGLVGDHVVVNQPGGELSFSKRGDEWFLTGPTKYVLSVNVDVAY